MLILAIPALLLFGLFPVWLLNRYLFGWYVLIENGFLNIYRPSSFKNKVNKYLIKDFRNFLWVIKETKGDLTTNSLWITNSQSHDIVIAEDFYMFKNTKKWQRFIEALSKATGLPVVKKTQEMNT